MQKPNIIYMHSHDTGRYIQPYGYAVHTPNLQKFAEQGVLFRNAHCVNPTCSASRAAMLSGQYPHQNGMLGLAHRGFDLNDPKKHIVHTLTNAGYECVLGGVQHVRDPKEHNLTAKQIGYQRSLDRVNNDAAFVAKSTLSFLREKHERPFFLSMGTFETHRKFPAASLSNDPKYLRPPCILPDTPETRQDWADYCTMANQLDEAYGRVLGELKATGLDQNTIVLITTDHGVAFPLMKCNLTDHGTGVLLMIRGPQGSAYTGGKVIDPLVSHLDVFPTLCELANITPPTWLEGKSLTPLVKGERAVQHEALFTTVNTHAATEPMRCVRTTNHSYIRRYDPRPVRVLPNVDAGLSKTMLVARDWAMTPEPVEALYDLTFDPMERHNVAHDSRYATALSDMQRRLAHWQQQTGDPLLNGELPLPAGAKLDDPESIEPS